MGKGAAQSGAAPAALQELRERLRAAEEAEDTEQIWLLRKAISQHADGARLEKPETMMVDGDGHRAA